MSKLYVVAAIIAAVVLFAAGAWVRGTYAEEKENKLSIEISELNKKINDTKSVVDAKNTEINSFKQEFNAKNGTKLVNNKTDEFTSFTNSNLLDVNNVQRDTKVNATYNGIYCNGECNVTFENLKIYGTNGIVESKNIALNATEGEVTVSQDGIFITIKGKGKASMTARDR